MKEVMDNFSKGAADYVNFRPLSPDGIFDFLYAHTHSFELAWDCGTGNGQVATRLAERFNTVYGTDISKEQLALAVQKDNIVYRVERAEQTSFPDRSIDLVTVAQAIHWFDLDNFYKEVKRVAKPGALIAAWTYTTPGVTPAVDKVISHLYFDITGPYWDPQRLLVDAGYTTIPFPFEELNVPELFIKQQWNIEQLLGYLRTWSGVQHCMKKEQHDPVALIETDLQAAWGPEPLLEVHWPVRARVGRV